MSVALSMQSRGRRSVKTLDVIPNGVNVSDIDITLGGVPVSFDLGSAISTVLSDIRSGSTGMFPNVTTELSIADRDRRLNAISADVKEVDFTALLASIRQSIHDAMTLQKDVLDILQINKVSPSKANDIFALVGQEVTRREIQRWLKSMYDRLQTYLFDPRTELPTLAAVNEDAARLLEDGRCLAIGTGDLSGMGTFNSAFGASITDRVVETQLRRLAQSVAGVNSAAVMGRRQMMQGDEFIFNLPDVRTLSDAEPYIMAIQKVLDGPIEFRLTAEDVQKMRLHAFTFEGSKNAKEQEAAKLIQETLANMSKLTPMELRPDDDAHTEVYVCRVVIGGRAGIKIVSPEDMGAMIDSNRVETLRSTDVQADLEGAVARNAQYESGLHNPVAVKDLNNDVHVLYLDSEGGLKSQIPSTAGSDVFAADPTIG